jgi:hypothetical protein
MSLDLSAYKAEVDNRFGRPLSLIFDMIQSAVNTLGTLAGVDPTGHTSPPSPPQAINVAAGSDHIHITLADASQRSRALNYFLEWSANDPSFGQPHVEHLGTSRGRVLALPAKDGSSVQIKYYFRAYSGYLGSQKASPKIYYGTNLSPSAVTLSGSSKLDLLPSTGAGTASTSGEAGGQGFGTAQFSEAA